MSLRTAFQVALLAVLIVASAGMVWLLETVTAAIFPGAGQFLVNALLVTGAAGIVWYVFFAKKEA